MPTLTIRDVPESVQVTLRRRAVLAKRSMEDEARDILLRTCGRGECDSDVAAVQDWVASLYGGSPPPSPSADLIAERRREASRE